MAWAGRAKAVGKGVQSRQAPQSRGAWGSGGGRITDPSPAGAQRLDFDDADEEDEKRQGRDNPMDPEDTNPDSIF